MWLTVSQEIFVPRPWLSPAINPRKSLIKVRFLRRLTAAMPFNRQFVSIKGQEASVSLRASSVGDTEVWRDGEGREEVAAADRQTLAEHWVSVKSLRSHSLGSLLKDEKDFFH